MKHRQTTTQASTDVAAKQKPPRAGKKGNGEDRHAVNLMTEAGDKGREEIIRETAYSFYEARGYVGGYDLDDWLQAEAKVRQMPGTDAGVS